MQKARRTIHQRNHLRLWKADFTCRGKPVWIGQISRDIGVRLTVNAPFFVTHKIDPEVDEARNYLAQDLLASEYLYALAFAKGAFKAPQETSGNQPDRRSLLLRRIARGDAAFIPTGSREPYRTAQVGTAPSK